MLADYLIAPSLNALFITGLILLFILILLVKNYNSIMRLNYYQKIMLLTSLSIAVGSHGLMHLGVEKQYNFNPYRWF
jgi:hypothetical protein